MEIFGNRNKPKNLNMKIITFSAAMKYAQDPNYADYEFLPVDENNLERGFRVQSKEIVREQINKIKRLNPSFEQSVIAGGIYKGIDEKITRNKYNNYQNAKGYRKQSKEIEIA